jgi:hypothetical protein
VLQAKHQTRTPAIWAHCDYTRESAERRLNSSAPEEKAARKWAIVNVWRSTVGTVQRKPMIFMKDSRRAFEAGDVTDVARISRHEPDKKASSIQVRSAHTHGSS